jgi:glycosyltransferase involved in cell wall biosynthesis
MKIAINANELCQSQTNGVKIYVYNILKCLAGKKRAVTIYHQKKIKKEWNIKSANLKHKLIKWPFPFWTHFRFPFELWRDKPDVFFTPIQTIPFFLPKCKIIAMVHDLAFLKFPNDFTFEGRLKLLFHTKRTIKKAEKIIVPSQTTKNDLIKYYQANPKQIEVIYHGASFKKKSQTPSVWDSGHSVSVISQPYILFVGTIQPRKNIQGLIEAFEILKNSHSPLYKSGDNIKLIIVGGKGWLWKKVFEKAEKSKYKKDIIFIGQVSSEKLSEIYQNAEVFILPSFYEGFGLPILEAMANGVPVIAGNNSSMIEITGDAGILINPYKPEEITKAIKKIIQNKNFREKLVEKGLKQAKKFTWEKCAKKTMEVLNEVGNQINLF